MQIKVMKKGISLLVSCGFVLSITGCSEKKEETSTIISNQNHSSEVVEDGFDNFLSERLLVEELLDQGLIDDAKSKIKDIFIQGVDFIFYDREISGVTFDELTDTAKDATMNQLEQIGELADGVFPGWREDLTEKYQIASEFISDCFIEALSFIRQYLKDENYEALIEIKDQIIGNVQEIKDDVKEHVKIWYEQFRSE